MASDEAFPRKQDCINVNSGNRCYSPIACGSFGYCREKNIAFVDEAQRLYGVTPVPYQRAIAMQRFEKGQSVREVVDFIFG